MGITNQLDAFFKRVLDIAISALFDFFDSFFNESGDLGILF